MRKKHLAAATALVGMAVASIGALAAYGGQEEEETDISMWKTSDGGYDYPVDAMDDEWYALSDVVEMREVTQIPDEILDSASTEELIELALKYPLLCDINAFDTDEEGYLHIKEQFNCINEILMRSDARDVLLEFYKNYSIPDEKIIDYDILLNDSVDAYNDYVQDSSNREIIQKDFLVCADLKLLEFMLGDAAASDETLAAEIASAYLEKYEQKEQSSYYDNINPLETLDYLCDNGILVQDVSSDSNMSTAAETSATSTTHTITIHNQDGVAVTCIYDTNVRYNDASLYTSEISTYHASLVSIASATFNCHSYAWLQKLYPSTYQYITLDSPGVFASDSHVTKLSSAAAGCIEWYSGHSAIVTQTEKDYPYDSVNIVEAYVQSKWGTGPIVAHYERHCPYYESEKTIYYYKRS